MRACARAHILVFHLSKALIDGGYRHHSFHSVIHIPSALESSGRLHDDSLTRMNQNFNGEPTLHIMGRLGVLTHADLGTRCIGMGW